MGLAKWINFNAHGKSISTLPCSMYKERRTLYQLSLWLSLINNVKWISLLLELAR